jgi:hypothetical protein
MVSYIFYDINGHFVKIAAIRLDGGISLSKDQSHSSSYSRISFKKEENGSKNQGIKHSFHFRVASFFRFMAANLSFTQFVTGAKPLYCV